MPLSNCSPRDAEIVCQLGETAATAPDDGKWGHGPCLLQVSGVYKPKMLTHGTPAIVQIYGMELGHKIRIAREEAGFASQRKLAHALGLSRGLIGQWESHKKDPGRETLIKLALVTGKPLSYFVDGVAPDPAILQTKFPDEIELIMNFRKMSPKQKGTHSALFRQSVAVRALVEQ